MKRSKTKTNELPYDCWTVVISYFSNTVDFIHVCSTVKGLYDYIKTINPQCTKNIRFALKRTNRLPSNQQRHVSNLLCINETKKGFCGSSTIQDLFRNISMKFINLLKFSYELNEGRYKQGNQTIFPNTISFSGNSYFRSLKLLMIHLPKHHNLKFHQSYPVLETIILSSNIKREGRRCDLDIEFASLPSLKNLRLTGWKTDSEFTGGLLQKKLETLMLLNIESDNFKTVSDFPKLRSLSLLDSDIEKLDLLPSIENVTICTLNPNRAHAEIFDCFHDLPSLKTLEIRFLSTHLKSLPQLGEKTVKIFNNPKLENINLHVPLFPISLSNMQNLEVLSVKYCYKPIFLDQGVANLRVIRFKNFKENRLVVQKLLEKHMKFSCKKLEVLSLISEGTDIVGLDNGLEISDLPCLKELEVRTSRYDNFPCYLVEKISNCPSLKLIDITPTRNGFTLSPDNELELDKLVFTFVCEGIETAFLNFIHQLSISQLKYIDECVFQLRYFDGDLINLFLDHSQIGMIRKLTVENVKKFEYNANGRGLLEDLELEVSNDVVLENIPKLERCRITTFEKQKGAYVCNLEVKNCQNLQSLKVENDEDKQFKKKASKLSITLEELNSLKQMKVDGNFVISKMNASGVNLEKVVFDLSNTKKTKKKKYRGYI